MKTGITLEEMFQTVVQQNNRKADYLTDTRNLLMEPNGDSVLMRMLDENHTDMVEPMNIQQRVHRQIGTFLKIPASYYDRMLVENPTLLASNVNAWFQQNPDNRMLRTLGGTARAFLSDSYRRIDHFEILQAVLPILSQIPDVRFESAQITEDRMYIKVVNPRLESEVAPGDIVQAGVVISNSETGQGSVSVQPLLLRLVCMNGMTVNDAGTRKYHVGRTNSADENFRLFRDETLLADDKAFMLKLQDIVTAATDEVQFNRVVHMMQAASGQAITSNDIPSVVKLVSKDYGLTETEGVQVLNHLIKDGDLSLYGLSNAVTRFSQDVESYDRATKLESIGYDILTIDPRAWQRLNQLQLPAAA